MQRRNFYILEFFLSIIANNYLRKSLTQIIFCTKKRSIIQAFYLLYNSLGIQVKEHFKELYYVSKGKFFKSFPFRKNRSKDHFYAGESFREKEKFLENFYLNFSKKGKSLETY
jgi:hypothetical protein